MILESEVLVRLVDEPYDSRTLPIDSHQTVGRGGVEVLPDMKSATIRCTSFAYDVYALKAVILVRRIWLLAVRKGRRNQFWSTDI